ncbi:hypothetical protein EVAR_57361_1 [Eumeta japonica]|uniref:Uncharacterized protein n=1 Tax=Eumeta variegata TaxID=151549 RepID=A0A4C1ZEM2_EUMVA|nr:hypothetical protein EVAR_57361_1 [Eumeta japonica]
MKQFEAGLMVQHGDGLTQISSKHSAGSAGGAGMRCAGERSARPAWRAARAAARAAGRSENALLHCQLPDVNMKLHHVRGRDARLIITFSRGRRRFEAFETAPRYNTRAGYYEKYAYTQIRNILNLEYELVKCRGAAPSEQREARFAGRARARGRARDAHHPPTAAQSRGLQQLASRWHGLYRRYCACVIPLFAPQSGDSCLLRVSALEHILFVFASWYDSTKLARIETSCSEIGRICNQGLLVGRAIEAMTVDNDKDRCCPLAAVTEIILRKGNDLNGVASSAGTPSRPARRRPYRVINSDYLRGARAAGAGAAAAYDFPELL